jgi:hypothetical protein
VAARGAAAAVETEETIDHAVATTVGGVPVTMTNRKSLKLTS